MGAEFLASKPRFAEIALALQNFLRDAELIIHNAAFDCDFLDSEFERLNMPPVRNITHNVLCTLNLSRRQNTFLRRHRLEDLCKHYGVDDSERTKHNALLDAKLLAEVYLHMTRGQLAMRMSLLSPIRASVTPEKAVPVRFFAASEEEIAAHNAYLDTMEKETGVRPLWQQ
jgi:DNA polymerase-3 subunit epsilon